MPARLRPLLDLPDEGIPMPDGVRLSARLWRPSDALRRPVPAVVEMIPYRKRDGTRLRDEAMHPWWAARGYGCLRVDLRGSGDSGGRPDDEYTARELADACAVIAWAAAQPWCSGAVGMMGKSWGGFNALQTAALRPPALRAVIAVCASTDRFADDIHFKGGALLGENLGWAAVMLGYAARPADPAMDAAGRAAWRERLAAVPFLAPRWAAEQARGAYWRHGSVCEDWQAIACPVLAVGGWADGYMNTVAALVGNLAVPVKGIVGPWVHQYPHTAVPAPRIGFLQEGLRWWDRWLKGVANGAEADPAYRVFRIDGARPDASAAVRPGAWRAFDRVPAAQTALALAPGGRLAAAQPEAASPGTVASPAHLGTAAGEYFPTGAAGEMAGDQREDDALSLCFETPPLPAPLDLVGAAALDLVLEADSPRAHLVARLCDVGPDGASARIAMGVLNLCHRDDPAAPSDVPVGRPVAVRLRLDQMAWRLPPGHRLRLALSTALWPFVWPAPRAARLVLREGRLLLPVPPPGAGRPWRFPPPVVPAVPAAAAGPAPATVRRVERDLISGRVRMVAEDGSTTTFADSGLTLAEAVAEVWEIDPADPLSARAEHRWRHELSRAGARVEIEAAAAMAGDAAALRLTARLVARADGAEVFRRDWDERVPRLWV